MEKLRVKDEDLEFINVDGGGMPIYHYQGKPFTGILLEYYDNILYRELEFVNGYEEGFERKYYENGRIASECYCKDNQPYGIGRAWDENGNLIVSTEWENGVQIK